MNAPAPLISDAWDIPDGVTYLNHGSFGPAPRPVRESQQRWTAELQRQPMEFFVRRLEGLLDETCAADSMRSSVPPGSVHSVGRHTA